MVKVDRVMAAWPLVRVWVPRVVAPSVNVTGPVGVPMDDVTIAVKVTADPKADGFRLELSAVAVGATFTVWVTAGAVLAPKPLAPEYPAITVWVPTVRFETLMLAWPSARVWVPRVVAPSVNVTVPVGVPEAEVTAAVKVTADPNVDGFGLELNAVPVDAAGPVSPKA